MKNFPVVLALGSAALLLILWAARLRSDSSEGAKAHGSRRPDPNPGAGHRAPDVADVALPSPSHPSAVPVTRADRPPQPRTSTGLWSCFTSPDSGSAGSEAVRATAAYLSVNPASRSAFEDAARLAIHDLEQALRLRRLELSASIPHGPTPKGQLESGPHSDARFDAARRGALERIEPFLNQSGSHQEFRREFDTWAATVSAKVRGVYR